MTDRRAAFRRGQAKETAKLAVRTTLHRRGLDLVRNPYPARVVAAARHLGVTTVLDVGANVGQYGSALRASGFAGRIVSCEPLSDAYGRLAARSGHDAAWTALHTAVGAAPGTVEINVSANSYSSSVLPMMAAHLDAAPGSEFIAVETVPVTTVADIVDAEHLDPATTMLKIDTQGYEGPVLDGAGELLARLPLVQLELSMVPLYDGQELYAAMTARMAAAGFTLYGLEPGFADPATGRMLQCDGLFAATGRLGR